MIKIQLQNVSGEWFTINTVMNQPSIIATALDSASSMYKKRVRAVDEKGSLIDLR